MAYFFAQLYERYKRTNTSDLYEARQNNVDGAKKQRIEYDKGLTSLESFLKYKSAIINDKVASALFTHLPPSIQVESFELAYATYRDGWNMDTMYSKIESKHPLIILILTAASRSVLGVYLSAALGPPSSDFKGDGTSFVFNIDCDGTVHFFEAKSDILSESCEVTGDIRRVSTLFEYAIGTNDYLAFGGSYTKGTNAIRLFSDLSQCSSGPSDTYGNNCSILPPDSGDAVFVRDVEIFTLI
jgi:hypothetical protein